MRRETTVLVICVAWCVPLLHGMGEDLPGIAGRYVSRGIVHGVSGRQGGKAASSFKGDMGEEQERIAGNLTDTDQREAADAAGMSEEHVSAFFVVCPSVWLRRRAVAGVPYPQLEAEHVAAQLDELTERLGRMKP